MLLTAVILAGSFHSALADTSDVRRMASDDCARARAANQPCVLQMDDEAVTGTSPTADGTTVAIALHAKLGSLIRIRRDFIVEILKTAEDL